MSKNHFILHVDDGMDDINFPKDTSFKIDKTLELATASNGKKALHYYCRHKDAAATGSTNPHPYKKDP